MTATINSAETAFAKRIASILSLTYGTTLYKGGVPDGIEEGAGVSMGAELSEDENQIPHFNAQIMVKSASRQTCLSYLEKLRTALPLYGITEDGVSIVQILKRGDGAVVRRTDNGKECFVMYYNVRVRFR